MIVRSTKGYFVKYDTYQSAVAKKSPLLTKQ
jgi:hypothetical protein